MRCRPGLHHKSAPKTLSGRREGRHRCKKVIGDARVYQNFTTPLPLAKNGSRKDYWRFSNSGFLKGVSAAISKSHNFLGLQGILLVFGATSGARQAPAISPIDRKVNAPFSRYRP